MFEWKQGQLFCEGVAVEKIARKYGTPVYIYSKDAIVKQISHIKEAFEGFNYLITYSLKANGNPYLLKLMINEGLGADTVSMGEVKLALKSGFRPNTIVFAGVGKREDELEFAIENGIKLINVESEEELNLLDSIAARKGKRVDVALRVNPDVRPDTIEKISTARKDSKFGIETESVERIFKNFKSKYLNIRGLHIHIGSQIFDWKPYKEAIERVEHLIDEVEIFDIGGGFGVDYHGGNREFDFQGLRENVLKPLSEKVGEIITEPGRFIVAPSGVLVTRVLYRKRNFVIVDAGMNDFSRPAYYGAFHRILNVHLRGKGKEIFAIGGPVCESTDVFGKEFEIERPERGDLLAIMDTGAYGMSMASNYNARPRPAEVLCDGETVKLIRRRENMDEVIWKNVP